MRGRLTLWRCGGVSLEWASFAFCKRRTGLRCLNEDIHERVVNEVRTMLRQIAEFIALLSCALFTGAAIYITFVEHPVWMQSGGELAATEFALTYRRAAAMQATCSAVGLLSSLAAWLAGATLWWL